MSEEKDLWQGTPSQVVNLGTFIFLGLFFWLLIPTFIALWHWLVTKNTMYALTTERLLTRHGVLNKQTDEMELYRIRDIQLQEPFFLRLFSLGNIVLHTSDRSHPRITIRAIENADQLREKLRIHVEACRVKKNVREVDFE